MSESLTNLQTIPKLPKRYEDTKPALNQVFTHMSILDVMQHICVEKVNAERIAGEKKLNDMVAKLYANFHIEKAESIEQAREEEREIAHEQINDLIKEFEMAMEKQRKEDQERALLNEEELRDHMEKEQIEAVKAAVANEQQNAKDYLMKEKKHHKNIISDLVVQIGREQNEKRAVTEELKRMTALKDSYVCKLKKARKELTGFVESSRPDFHKGQADYLFSSNLFEFEVGDQ